MVWGFGIWGWFGVLLLRSGGRHILVFSEVGVAGTAEVGVAETYDATVFMLLTRTILEGARLVFTIYVVRYGICIRTELHESEGYTSARECMSHSICPDDRVYKINYTGLCDRYCCAGCQ